MGASFLITLREGLEIALVLAILAGYLVKTGRSHDLAAMWKGTFAALGLCLIFGVAIHLAVGGLNGKVEQATEGVIAVAAASVLTWMIFWMRKTAHLIKGDLHEKMDSAVEVGGVALAALAAVAVGREGLETALFLWTNDQASSGAGHPAIGGLLGIIVAVGLGYLIYKFNLFLGQLVTISTRQISTDFASFRQYVIALKRHRHKFAGSFYLNV